MERAELVAGALTVVAGLIVLFTALRLRNSHGSVALFLHTWLGLIGVATWLTFVFAPDDNVLGGALMGVIGLGCWWVVSLAGFVLTFQHLPRRGHGKRVADVADDPSSWTASPWLSALLHLAVFGIALWFTWIYVMSIV